MKSPVKRTAPKRCIALLIALLLACAALPPAAAAESLFPSPDELFGVTMPDIRYAVKREADEKTETDEGQTFTYTGFTKQDYAALDAYLASGGLKEKCHELIDGILTVMLTKDDADITLRYAYGERKATLVYPAGTRLEKMAHKSGNETILPDLRYQFGIAIPDLSGQLPLHPRAQKVKEGTLDVIRYPEVSRADYAVINEHLTALNYETLEWHADGGVMFATITDSKGALTLRYELQEQRFSFICPELYYLDDSRSAEMAKDVSPVLPDLQEAMGAILPRISTALLRYPDSEENGEETYSEVYQNFSPEDYAVFSAYLLDKGCTVGNYYVNDTGELVIPLSIGTSGFTFTYDQVGGRAIMDYPAGAQLEPVFAASAAATPTPRPTVMPTATPMPTTPPKNYSESECWARARSYFNNLAWKNPSSVTIHSYSTSPSDGGYVFYIDYSAMNGFGGYNRETYMIKVNWTTGRIEYAYSF